MKYRLVRIANFYKEYLNFYYSFYKDDITKLSYHEQYEHLINNSCELYSYFSKKFNMLDVEAFDIISNATFLQDQWKKENKCNEKGKNLIIHQLKQINPDVVWIDDTQLLEDIVWISNLKKNVSSVRIITGHFCAPYNIKLSEGFRKLDFLFTCTPGLKKEFEDMGIPTYLNYHSFEKSILDRIKIENVNEKKDIVFTGSFFTGGLGHITRIEYIEKLLNSEINVQIFGNIDSEKKIRQKRMMYDVFKFFKKIGLFNTFSGTNIFKKYKDYSQNKAEFYSEKFHQAINPPVFGIDMFKLLSHSKICLNIHGELSKDCAGNIRLFEATGVGCCLVTDWKKNLSDLFEIDKEIVAYKSLDECIEKIKWLNEHPEEREKIAKAGQLRTLKDHKFSDRIIKIDEIIRKHLNN